MAFSQANTEEKKTPLSSNKAPLGILVDCKSVKG